MQHHLFFKDLPQRFFYNRLLARGRQSKYRFGQQELALNPFFQYTGNLSGPCIAGKRSRGNNLFFQGYLPALKLGVADPSAPHPVPGDKIHYNQQQEQISSSVTAVYRIISSFKIGMGIPIPTMTGHHNREN